MSQDEFTKLFVHMNKRFDELEVLFDKTNQSIDGYASAVDGFAKQSENYMQEMLALGHKVDRLERWIMQIADATGVKLAP